jgi:hypothetical protein
MTYHEDVSALRARIAAAEVERDGWRASGMQENYLEAYSRVEALELQLEGLRQEGSRNTARSEHPVQRELEEHRSVPGDEDRLMSELSIRYDGRQYHYDRYGYDQLQDAIDHARLRQSLPGGEAALPMPATQRSQAPGALQRQLMAELAITFHGDAYHLGPYRYTMLDDAVNYARLLRTQGREVELTRDQLDPRKPIN